MASPMPSRHGVIAILAGISFRLHCHTSQNAALEEFQPASKWSREIITPHRKMIEDWRWNMVTPGTGKVETERPKRELSPLQRACRSLGLPIDARPKTSLHRLLRKAGIGSTVIQYLEFSKSDQAQTVVQLFSELNATERKAATIDLLILAAGVDVHHIIGQIAEGASRAGREVAMMLAYASLPEVTRITIERAQMPEGAKDRALVFQLANASGLLAENGRRLS
jgi:hypothetical protein